MRNFALGLAMVLVVLSLLVQYTDPLTNMQSLALDSPEAGAAFAFLAESPDHWFLAKRSDIRGAWLKPSEPSAVVLWLRTTDRWSWLVTVEIDTKGSPTSASVDFYRRKLVSNFLTGASIAWVAMWSTFFAIIPAIFGAKCPRCTRAAHWPILTRMSDRTVYAGGMDRDGQTLPPIIERSYVCPICGYRKVIHRIPETYRAVGLPIGHLGASLWPKFGERGEKIVDKFLERLAHNKTYDDWRGIFQEWKTQDREEYPEDDQKP